MPSPAQQCTAAEARPLWRVVKLPTDSPLDDDVIAYVVTSTPPTREQRRSKAWLDWWQWGAAGFTVEAIAQTCVAMLNGEPAPEGRRSDHFVLRHLPPPLRREYQDTPPGEARYRQALKAPRWVIDVKGVGAFGKWPVGEFFDEGLARDLLAQLTETHVDAVRAADDALQASFVTSDRRRLARDPAALAVHKALAAYLKAHPRADLHRLEDAAELAVRVLLHEAQGRKGARL